MMERVFIKAFGVFEPEKMSVCLNFESLLAQRPDFYK